MSLRDAFEFFNVERPARTARAEAETGLFENRLRKRRASLPPEAGVVPWLDAADEAVAAAEANIRKGRTDIAWRNLHEARRQEVFGYAPEEIEAGARALKNEAAAKLTGWRQLTVGELVLPIIEKKAGVEDARCRLSSAMRLRDESDDNRYFKLGMLQRQVVWLIVLKLLVFIALMALLYLWRADISLEKAPAGAPDAASHLLTYKELWVGILFGALGACFSGLVSLVASSPDVSIPERVASTSVTIARPIIGGVSALAGLLLLSAGLLAELGASATYAIAFAFGFSERLAIGALDRFTPKT